MKRILVLAKSLQVGDYVVTQPVDKDNNPVDKQYTERVIAVGINLSDRTVDIRTNLDGQTRSAMGMPMDLELEIFRDDA